ncbi:hypothetical protein DY000_02008301 [Brassica cretica]|uniref:Uncharacterized protein n=1 Tax=Brassica cretica TaxID=69181 RepID=A0ABQ7CHQ5_BRACR|nr:hypothetical protein DY000_02008301 [Brassica cretica]
MSDGRCRSTEDECLRSIMVSEYRSTGLVSGSTVVDRIRSMNKWCYRPMWSVPLCGLNAPSLQDLVRTVVESFLVASSTAGHVPENPRKKFMSET